MSLAISQAVAMDSSSINMVRRVAGEPNTRAMRTRMPLRLGNQAESARASWMLNQCVWASALNSANRNGSKKNMKALRQIAAIKGGRC